MWSGLVFDVQNLIVKLTASTLQADRRKLIVSVLMGFVLIAILCLKQWVAFTTFVLVKSYVPCDIEVPENLRANFGNFPPFFKNTLVSKKDIDDLLKTYAEEERIMSQPRKMLISGFSSQNGTLITPVLLFYLQLGLGVTKIPWTQEGKVTKMPFQVSLPRQWNL